MKCYRVVYEHHKVKNNGGQVGTRFFLTYTDREDFCNNCPTKFMHDLKIVARRVSLDKALDLTALTPEVCTLTRTVNAILTMSGSDHASKSHIDNEFRIAQINIDSRRKRRQINSLAPQTKFPFVDVRDYPKDSVSRVIYEYIKDNYLTPNGLLDDPEKAIDDTKNFLINTFNQHGIVVS